MTDEFSSPFYSMESEHMPAWERLRRELEERITDEETRALFREFLSTDIALHEEEANESFWRGMTAALAIRREENETGEESTAE